MAGIPRGRPGDRVAARVGGGGPRGRARRACGRRLGLSESQEEAVDSITAQIVNKLLHLPTVRLKEAAAGADGGGYAQAVRHLFGLGDDDE